MTHAISAAGLALIQEHEGFRARPEPMPDGNWVVGYGHVRVGEAGKPVTRKEAAELLAGDLAPVEAVVNAKVGHALTQAQFDALASFAFSIGTDAFVRSQVLRRVNAGEFIPAACAMDAWRKSEITGELEIAGALVRRRAAEKALFLQDLPQETAPSVLLRAKLDHAAAILGAPSKRAPAPQVEAPQAAPPKPEPGQRLTQILKSEPATAALLLTQVVAEDAVVEDEIVTAHAKPVARKIESPTAAPAVIAPVRLKLARGRAKGAAESLGLIALLALGLALIGVGASLVFNGRGDAVEVAGAAALAAPGVAAALMAAVGLWRGPHARGGLGA
jgi:lysozyme